MKTGKITSKELNKLDDIYSIVGPEIKTILKARKPVPFFPITFFDKDKNFEYFVLSYGNVYTGYPCAIVITNIELPILIKIEGDPESLKADIKEFLKKNRCFANKYGFTEGKPFNGYQHEKDSYLELYFKSLSIRNKAINLLSEKFDVMENDKSMLHRNTMAKYGLNTANWLKITKYNYYDTNNPGKYSDFHDGIILEVDVRNISNIKNTSGKNFIEKKQRKLAWDIETKTYGVYGKPKFNRIVPDVLDSNYDVVFMASFILKWHQGDDIINILLTTKDQNVPKEDDELQYVTILCEDQFDLIGVFFKLFKMYRPNEVLDFNGMKFDWPMVNNRLRHNEKFYKNVIEMLKFSKEGSMTRRYMKFGPSIKYNDDKRPKDVKDFGERIKLGGTAFHNGDSFSFTDCVHIDLLPMMLKDFEYNAGDKSNIRSLNAFLEDNEIPTKKDMPYHVMHKYYDEGDLDKMKLVGDYCIYDSIALHRLEEKRNIIDSVQKMADLTHTTLKDGVYNANGIKILNKIRQEAFKKNLVMRSNWVRPNHTQFGAIVLTPNVGLHAYNKFDFDKYTPSLQEELSYRDLKFRKQSIDSNEGHIKELQSKRLRVALRKLIAKYPPKIEGIEWVADRPSSALDYTSLYPSVEREENMSPESVLHTQEEVKDEIKRGTTKEMIHKHTFAGETKWIKQHGGDKKNMALIPTMLNDLFERRLVVKNLIKDYHKQLDANEKKLTELLKDIDTEDLKQLVTDVGNGDLSAIDGNLKEIKVIVQSNSDLKFLINLKTSEEKAIKIVLNSTYGMFGDGNNRHFYSPYITQGTCNLGRFYLLCAKIFSEHYGFVVNYGDTDSIYISAPEHCFDKVDKLYQDGKISIIEYKKEMIRINIRETLKMGDIINSLLVKEFNTVFMKIVYEETLYPVVYISKKFYTGTIHKKDVNDDFLNHIYNLKDKTTDFKYISEHVFQRGIATRKRDKSGFVKQCLFELLLKCFDFELKDSLLNICAGTVQKIMDNKYDRRLFLSYATYKRGCANVKNNTFARNMMDQFNEEIDDLEKFKYYVVKRRDFNFTVDGRRITKIGDRMVLAKFADDMELDMEYYVGTFIGSLKTILTYHHMFIGEREKQQNDAEKYLKGIYKGNMPKGYRSRETNINKKLFKNMKNEKMHIYNIQFNLELLGSDDMVNHILQNTKQIVTDKFYHEDCSGSTIEIDKLNITSADVGMTQHLVNMVKSKGEITEEYLLDTGVKRVGNNRYKKKYMDFLNNELEKSKDMFYKHLALIKEQADDVRRVITKYNDSLTEKIIKIRNNLNINYNTDFKKINIINDEYDCGDDGKDALVIKRFLKSSNTIKKKMENIIVIQRLKNKW